MILHSTPPSSLHIPNPALGYLKGFLQSKGIHVKNVYWNLVLARSIFKFQRGLKKYSEKKDFFSISPVLYISRQLLTDNPGKSATPLDLLYLSLYSREELAEMIHTIKEEIDRHIYENNLHKTALAGFTVKSYQWLMSYYLTNRLKEMNPDIKIVIGGITGEDQGRAFMKLFNLADYLIWGEGEYPLVHLVKALKEGTPLKDVPNLIYREGTTLVTEKAHKHSPLDLYPFADHSDYFTAFQNHMTGSTLSEYIKIFGKYVPDRYPVVIPILGSRSCKWNRCRFCVLNEEYTYRARSPENIVKEIEYQSERYHIDSFIFVDTEIAGTLKRFKTLLKLLIQSSAEKEKKYRFFAEVSPIFIDNETARYMQLASFTEIQIGFEAMTDSLLEKIDKQHRFAHNLQAVKLGNQNELQISGLNILRELPTETKEDILESCANLKFLRFFLKKYPLTPGFLRLDKGAPFYKDVSEEERKKWRKNPIWEEVNPLHLIPEEDKYEFFGFYKMDHDRAWVDFESLMNFYMKQDRSYQWVDYVSGSFVEEKGLRLYKYIFDRDETDLLIFCDIIKSFSQVKKRFPHLSEDDLCKMLQNLKDVGFIYCDNAMRWVVSVLDAARRKILVYHEH